MSSDTIPTRVTVFGSGELFHIARVLAVEAQTDPIKAIASIPMAAAAVEAYLNDLAQWTRQMSLPKSEEWFFAELYEYAEEARRPALHRAELVSRVFRGTRPDRGSRLWQDMALLFRVRDALMHRRPFTWSSDDAKNPPSQLVGEDLIARKIARRPNPITADEQSVTLGQIVAQAPVARWAYDTAVDAWQEIMDQLPRSIQFVAFAGAQPTKLQHLE